MASDSIRFGAFRLDPADRRLMRDGAPVDLNARYLDALMLLVRERGQLVSKDRFFEDVWRGVPVTDDALTQCIATLRRQLGDTAAHPRFIETVPKHGYRFIAPVTFAGAMEAAAPARVPHWRPMVDTGIAGTAGAAVAGLIGGLLYGVVATAPGPGAISALLVLASVTLLIAVLGGGAVSFGIALARTRAGSALSATAGGAAGGLLVGTIAKLLGLDAFNLLLGRAPSDFTGPGEGLILGGSLGAAAWFAARRRRSPGRAMLAGAVAGAGGAIVIVLLGGRLLGGSLELLSHSFPASRLRLSQIGAMFGEAGLGPTGHVVTAALEGALFGACLIGAMSLARPKR